jgi:hypothetical protein
MPEARNTTLLPHAAVHRQQRIGPLQRLRPEIAMLSEWTGPQNLRSIHEDARNVARDIAKTEDHQT